MLDEVQWGIGRTGKWFAHQHSSVLPDVMTLAKGMGSGVPVGACLAAGKVTGTFKPGNHGSTFGGNPLACVAVLTTLDVIQQDRLVANAATVGSLIQQELRTRLTTVAGVVDIRGQGLIIGIELDRPCGDLVNQALTQGLLINVTAENVIRLLPPLVLTSSEALQLLDKLCPLIVNFLTQDV
jgi:acetylornithine aminotransferase